VVLFMSAYLLVWVAGTLALASDGLDFVTATSASLTALNNVGPGLGHIVGPVGNFSTLSDFSKWVLTIAMLLGRLEILAVFVLLSPTFWRN
jgi:trk system potassium uptake protein TrkH